MQESVKRTLQIQAMKKKKLQKTRAKHRNCNLSEKHLSWMYFNWNNYDIIISVIAKQNHTLSSNEYVNIYI